LNLDPANQEAIGLAMNEATLLGVEVDTESRMAGVTLDVLTLPERGDPPSDRRVQFVLSPVGRVAASLRLGRWNDAGAPVEHFEIGALLGIVESFKTSIYGWEFFDQHEKEMAGWGARLSVNWRSGSDGLSHSLFLFQEGGPQRHLDLCIWFDELVLRDPRGREIAQDEFIAGGRRWWTAFRAGDPRTHGEGLIPLKEG